ncbi:MAG TPA: ABC transporter permease [Thermotogota bacterium]|nr:ABC transporter permease [Thermotogota bacterium]HPJ89474.1 ABC transporter permease [Thermotogota bacterium]HPR96338.1 ABC transporter permease [Thermotogota bacterium]
MELFIETLRALFSNKLRTFLSMLGIIIGVTSMIAVVSIGQGATASITERVSSLGSNVLIISPGFSGGFGGRSFQALSGTLTKKDVENIDTICTDVEDVSPIIQQSFRMRYSTNNSSAQVYAVYQNFFDILSLEVASGRGLTEQDIEDYAKIGIIGAEKAEDLFDDEDPLGKTIYVTVSSGDYNKVMPIQIVGVLEETGSRLMYDPDNMLIIPFTTAEGRIVGSGDSISSILATAKDSDSSDLAYLEIDQVLYMRLQDSTKYSITSQDSILSTVSEVTGIMNLFLGSIAAISLLVGGIGIMNIMLVSVSERTREIGIKKALGATRHRILLEFLVESIVITFVAGAIGVGCGIGISKLVEILATAYSLKTQVTWGSITVAFGTASMIGLFFGIYPASKASKLSPLEALRYE